MQDSNHGSHDFVVVSAIKGVQVLLRDHLSMVIAVPDCAWIQAVLAKVPRIDQRILIHQQESFHIVTHFNGTKETFVTGALSVKDNAMTFAITTLMKSSPVMDGQKGKVGSTSAIIVFHVFIDNLVGLSAVENVLEMVPVHDFQEGDVAVVLAVEGDNEQDLVMWIVSLMALDKSKINRRTNSLNHP